MAANVVRWLPNSGGKCERGAGPRAGPPSQKEQRESALAAVMDGVYGSAGYQVMRRVPIRGAKRRSDPGVGRTLGEV